MKHKLFAAGKRLLRLFCPPLPLLFFLFFLSPVALVYGLVDMKGEGVVSYLAYGLSAYTLTATVCQGPAILKKIRTFKKENPLLVRYFSDPALRIHTSLTAGLLLGFAYTLFQIALGIYHRSLWFSAFAVYYALLSCMRLYLLTRIKKRSDPPDILSEYRCYRLVGILLACMTLTLGGIVGYSLRVEPAAHHSITVIAMATYTFTALTLAITGAVRYKKYQSPLFSAAKAIGITTASVSMLTLETAMLTAFGDNDGAFHKVMISITGIALLLLILALSVYMTVKAHKSIHRHTAETNT